MEETIEADTSVIEAPPHKVKVRSAAQEETLRRAREKALQIRKENAELRKKEKMVLAEKEKVVKLTKKQQIEQEYNSLIPANEEDEEEEVEEVPVKKPKKVVKRRVVVVESSSEEEEEIEVRLPKKRKQPIAVSEQQTKYDRSFQKLFSLD